MGLGPQKIVAPPEIRPTETCPALMVSMLPSHTAPMLLYTEANAPRAPNGPQGIRVGDGAVRGKGISTRRGRGKCEIEIGTQAIFVYDFVYKVAAAQ